MLITQLLHSAPATKKCITFCPGLDRCELQDLHVFEAALSNPGTAAGKAMKQIHGVSIKPTKIVKRASLV